MSYKYREFLSAFFACESYKTLNNKNFTYEIKSL